MSSDEDVVIDVRHLKKRYEIYPSPRARLKQLIVPALFKRVRSLAAKVGIQLHRPVPQYFQEFWALDDVSFQVRRGETFGIIGKNGSGKSTLLQILAGTLSPTSGEVIVKGRVAALLELGSGFNPEFTGRENIFLNARILGLSQKEIEERFDQILEFADIGEFIDQPVKTYSSGMFVRLAFAVQAHINASIVIIDEALAVGDVFFRQKCYARLEQLRNSGAAILLVSHSMSEIEQYCERSLLLNYGVQKFCGPSSQATKYYYLMDQSSEGKENLKPTIFSNNIASGGVFRKSDKGIEVAYLDISDKAQVGNGKARCIAVGLSDRDGHPTNIFRQGDIAVFYYEFEVYGVVGIPVCGLVISNDKGLMVHGKNSWQMPIEVEVITEEDGVVMCKQEVSLRLAPGEYVFQVGLACVDEADWNNRENISLENEGSLFTRLCHVPQVGHFQVMPGLRNGMNFLSHHGIADLDGQMDVTVSRI